MLESSTSKGETLLRSLYIVIIMALPFWGSAQEASLIYLRQIIGENNFSSGKLSHMQVGENSGFIMQLRFNVAALDAGIWQEEPITELSNQNRVVVIYNHDFEYLGHFQLPNHIDFEVDYHPIGVLENNYYFKGATYTTINIPFSSIPSISAPQAYVSSNNLIFNFNLTEYSTEAINHWLNPSVNVASPFQGYSGTNELSRRLDAIYSAALTNDNKIVSSASFFSDHEHNWETNYNAVPGHRGYLWCINDLSTGESLVTPVISETGNVESRAIHYSPDEDALYRVGTVRGHGTTISPAGDIWSTQPEDSAYYAYLAKETIGGNLVWSIPLYSYSNTNPDTINLNDPNFLTFHSGTHTFAELNNNLFLSHSSRIAFSAFDTINFVDVFDNVEVYDAMVPGFNSAFSTRCVYKVSADGTPLGKLSYDLDLNNSHPNTIEGNINRFKENIFKIGDKLAWVNLHLNNDGSPAVFKRETPGEVISLTEEIIPPGKSISISWLNEELELIDFWIIPFESTQYAPNIEFMTEYGSDTLLIQGNSRGLTSCNYDPSGLAPTIETPMNSTFIAFYSGLNSLGSSDFEHKSYKLKVYPNPSTGMVNVLATFPIDRIVVSNLLGQVVMGQGAMQQLATTVNLEDLPAGMYLLSAEGTDQRSTQMVMVQH